MLLQMLAKNWWLILLRGLVAIIAGLLAFVWPGLTLVTLVILYGIYVLADGGCALAAAIKGSGHSLRWWLAIVGLLSIGAGLAIFIWPGMTALLLMMLIGVWSVAHGLIEIIGAIQLRKEIDNEWLLILSGILAVIFGIFVLVRPGAGALALVWVIAGYTVAFGVLMVALALRLKKHHAVVL